MRSRAATLAARLRHHADAGGVVLSWRAGAAGAAEGAVGLHAARAVSSWAAGPRTPPTAPTVRAFRGLRTLRLTRSYASSAADAAASAAAPSTPPITLTPAAAVRIRELLARPDAVSAGHTALRLTVEAGGCSGFSYVFALDGGPQKGDTAVVAGEGEAPLLIIDPVSLGLVQGGTIDFVSELIKAGFEVTVNPNADAGCGCGASFTPKF